MHYCAIARQTIANKITSLHICFQTEDWKEQEESKREPLNRYLLLAMASSMRTHIWKECLQPRSLPSEMKFCKFFVYDWSVAKITLMIYLMPFLCGCYNCGLSSIAVFGIGYFSFQCLSCLCLVLSRRPIIFLMNYAR